MDLRCYRITLLLLRWTQISSPAAGSSSSCCRMESPAGFSDWNLVCESPTGDPLPDPRAGSPSSDLGSSIWDQRGRSAILDLRPPIHDLDQESWSASPGLDSSSGSSTSIPGSLIQATGRAKMALRYARYGYAPAGRALRPRYVPAENPGAICGGRGR